MTDELNLESVGEGVDMDIEAPEDPGPALLGKTPVIGQLRRENDLPVIRDEVAEELE